MPLRLQILVAEKDQDVRERRRLSPWPLALEPRDSAPRCRSSPAALQGRLASVAETRRAQPEANSETTNRVQRV
jgi:hypothetical protein